MIKAETAERGNVAQAGAPVAKGDKDKKKPDGKKEDAYEMAVAYTKEGDFAGWYSDVSGLTGRDGRVEWYGRGERLTADADLHILMDRRCWSREICWTTTMFLDATFSSLGRTPSGNISPVSKACLALAVLLQRLIARASVRLVRCRDQEAWS